MPLLGRSGAASAKAFGLTASVSSGGDELYTAIWASGSYGSFGTSVVLGNAITNSLITFASVGTLTTSNFTYGLTTNAFNTAYAARGDQTTVRKLTPSTSTTVTLPTSISFYPNSGMCCGNLSSNDAFFSQANTYYYTNNGGSSWSNIDLNTISPFPVLGVLTVVTNSGTAYLILACGYAYSSVDLRVYKTTNLSSFTYLTTIASGLAVDVSFWSAFYDYTNKIINVFQLYNSNIYSFNVSTETAVTSSTYSSASVNSIAYLKGTSVENYWGSSGTILKKSSNLSSWTNVYDFSVFGSSYQIKQIYAMKGSDTILVLLLRNTGGPSYSASVVVAAYYIKTNSASFLLNQSVDGGSSAELSAFATVVSSGDNFFVGYY